MKTFKGQHFVGNGLYTELSTFYAHLIKFYWAILIWWKQTLNQNKGWDFKIIYRAYDVDPIYMFGENFV